MMSALRLRSDACLSDLTLDRLLVDELDVAANARALAHLATCDRCRERRRAIEVDAAAAALPPLTLPRRRSALRDGIVALSVAAAAILLVRLPDPDAPSAAGDRSHDRTEAPTRTRTKGSPRLRFHVKRGSAVLEGGPGEILRPGDVVRFGYSWPQDGTVAVLSRDGVGAVNVYFPEGPVTQSIVAGEEMDLPGAVLLDDILGPEIFVGVFCPRPVAIAAIKRALVEGAPTPALDGCLVDRVQVEKRGGR